MCISRSGNILQRFPWIYWSVKRQTGCWPEAELLLSIRNDVESVLHVTAFVFVSKCHWNSLLSKALGSIRNTSWQPIMWILMCHCHFISAFHASKRRLHSVYATRISLFWTSNPMKSDVLSMMFKKNVWHSGGKMSHCRFNTQPAKKNARWWSNNLYVLTEKKNIKRFQSDWTLYNSLKMFTPHCCFLNK